MNVAISSYKNKLVKNSMTAAVCTYYVLLVDQLTIPYLVVIVFSTIMLLCTYYKMSKYNISYSIGF